MVNERSDTEGAEMDVEGVMDGLGKLRCKLHFSLIDGFNFIRRVTLKLFRESSTFSL